VKEEIVKWKDGGDGYYGNHNNDYEYVKKKEKSMKDN
jgi:hypothetical protein